MDIRGVFNSTRVEIQLLDKNSSGPATNGISYIEKEPSVLANTHVTNRGWLGQTDAATQAGTTGQRLSLQAMQLRLSENTIGGGITYQSHIANKGWETKFCPVVPEIVPFCAQLVSQPLLAIWD